MLHFSLSPLREVRERRGRMAHRKNEGEDGGDEGVRRRTRRSDARRSINEPLRTMAALLPKVERLRPPP